MDRSTVLGNEIRNRFTWGSSGFLFGLLVGLVFGWQFHWVFNTIVFLLPLLIVLVLVAAGYMGVKRFTDRRDIRQEVEAEEERERLAGGNAIDTRSRVVHEETDRVV